MSVPASDGQNPAARAGYDILLSAGAAAGTAFVIGIAVWLHHSWQLQNHDMDWLMVAARRMLQGGRFTTEIDEVTPPLVLLLLAPAAWLASLLQWKLYTAFLVYVGGLIAFSTLLAAPVLRWCTSGAPIAGRLAIVAYALILAHEPGYEFGQREHIFVIMALPGLLWYAAREAGRDSPMDARAWVSLCLAAVGLMIKPYYLIIPLVLLSIRLYRLRSWRALLDPPAAILVVACLLYALVVLVFFPEYLEVARLNRQVYFAWDRGWITVADNARDAVAVLCLAAILGELRTDPGRSVARTMTAIGACCLLVAFSQKKGWPYHMLPVVEIAAVSLAISACALLADLARARRDRIAAIRPATALAGLGAAALLGASMFIRPASEMLSMPQSRFVTRPLIARLHAEPEGQVVMLLTSGLQFGFPSLAGVEIGSRHPGQLLLPGTVRLEAGTAEQREKAKALRQVAQQWTARDLRNFRPALVAVDRNAQKQGLPDDFDILPWYLTDAAFREAWADYEFREAIPGWDIYVRKPGR